MSLSESMKSGYTRLKEFLGAEVPNEMKKVSWPNKQSVYSSTKAVIVSVLLISIFIAVIDMGLTRVFEVILRVR